MSFLVMHQLQGMIDGSIPQPVSHIVVSYGMQQPNPEKIYGFVLIFKLGPGYSLLFLRTP